MDKSGCTAKGKNLIRKRRETSTYLHACVRSWWSPHVVQIACKLLVEKCDVLEGPREDGEGLQAPAPFLALGAHHETLEEKLRLAANRRLGVSSPSCP